MGLKIVWPIKKRTETYSGWMCYECPMDMFGERPTFDTTDLLDTHRRSKHFKGFEGDVNIKESVIIKLKRKIFRDLLDMNKNEEEE